MKISRSLLWMPLCVVGAVVLWLLLATLVPRSLGEGRMVQIPRGVSASEVGRILAREEIIRSPLGFRLLARVTGKGTDLKSGGYELSPSMTPLAVMDKMARGEVCARWVTFPEGFTIRRIADRLAAERLAEADGFVGLARHGGASFPTSFPHPAGSLEGYLFPDTYLISISESEDAIIQGMLSCFERKVAKPLAADISRSGMSLHQVITLASLIEREAKVPKDRALISAVLHNRLRRGMRLQVDATVLYALGRHKNRVRYTDLEVDSPYNTYKYAGLPPGPIANPGLESVKAALHPAKVGYLYYVARPDGSHVFSLTLAEHERAKNAVRGTGGG